jgi:ATP synthase protein I
MPKARTPESDDTRQEALKQLDEQLDAFEAKRRTSAGPLGDHGGVNEGYRLVAGLIGGVLGGVGLGWFFDHLAHTSPIGLIGGLLIGTVVSIVGAVASASRMSARMTAQTGPVPPASADEDDE